MEHSDDLMTDDEKWNSQCACVILSNLGFLRQILIFIIDIFGIRTHFTGCGFEVRNRSDYLEVRCFLSDVLEHDERLFAFGKVGYRLWSRKSLYLEARENSSLELFFLFIGLFK